MKTKLITSKFMKKQTLDFVREGKNAKEIIEIFNNHNFNKKYWNAEGVENLINKYEDFMEAL